MAVASIGKHELLSDVSDLLDALKEVTDWFKLGCYLKLPIPDLKEIETEHHKDLGRCKTEMLDLWLRRETSPTWLLLADALERMGEKKLAQHIRIMRRQTQADVTEISKVIPGLWRSPAETSFSSPEPVGWSVHGSSNQRKHPHTRSPLAIATPTTGTPNSFYLGSAKTKWNTLSSLRMSANGPMHYSIPVSSVQPPLPSTPHNHPPACLVSPPDHPQASPPPSSSPLPSLCSPLPQPLKKESPNLPSPSGAPFGSSTTLNPDTTQFAQGEEACDLNISSEFAQDEEEACDVSMNICSHSSEIQSAKADRTIWLMECFANLQNELQIILHHEVGVNIYQLQAFIQQLPVSLDDPDKRLLPDERQELRSTVDIFQIFSLLGKYIHYNSYHLLKAVVHTFGNVKSRKLMDAYVMELKTPGESNRAMFPTCAVAELLVQDARMVAAIKMKFANLLIDVLRILKDVQKVDVDSLATFVLHAPLSSTNFRRILNEDVKELTKSKSVSHIFSIIGSYISFDGYLLLECVVNQFGNDRAKHMMQKYNRRLNQLKQRCSLLRDASQPTLTHQHQYSSSHKGHHVPSQTQGKGTGKQPAVMATANGAPGLQRETSNDEAQPGTSEGSIYQGDSFTSGYEGATEQQKHIQTPAENTEEQPTQSATTDMAAEPPSESTCDKAWCDGPNHSTCQEDSSSNPDEQIAELQACSQTQQAEVNFEDFVLPATVPDSQRETASIETEPGLHKDFTHQDNSSSCDEDTTKRAYLQTESTGSHTTPFTTANPLSEVSSTPHLQQACLMSRDGFTHSEHISTHSGQLTVTSPSPSKKTEGNLSMSTVQTTTVAKYFVPRIRGQIHVCPGQKVTVEGTEWVNVVTESGRKGYVPSDVLNRPSLLASSSLQQDRQSSNSSQDHCRHSRYSNLDNPSSLSYYQSSHSADSNAGESSRDSTSVEVPDVLRQRRNSNCSHFHTPSSHSPLSTSSTVDKKKPSQKSNTSSPSRAVLSAKADAKNTKGQQVMGAPSISMPSPKPSNSPHNRPQSLPTATPKQAEGVSFEEPEATKVPKKSIVSRILSPFRRIRVAIKGTPSSPNSCDQSLLTPSSEFYLALNLNSTQTSV